MFYLHLMLYWYLKVVLLKKEKRWKVKNYGCLVKNNGRKNTFLTTFALSINKHLPCRHSVLWCREINN